MIIYEDDIAGGHDKVDHDDDDDNSDDNSDDNEDINLKFKDPDVFEVQRAVTKRQVVWHAWYFYL